jgi:hypothetical protein
LRCQPLLVDNRLGDAPEGADLARNAPMRHSARSPG